MSATPIKLSAAELRVLATGQLSSRHDNWLDPHEVCVFVELENPSKRALFRTDGPDTGSIDEKVDDAQHLLRLIEPSHNHIDIGTSAHDLGSEATQVLLAGIRTHATQWDRFSGEVRREPVDRNPLPSFRSLPDVLGTITLLPNLRIVELGFQITEAAYPLLVQLFRQGSKLESLAITDHGFHRDLLHDFLRDVALALPTIPLRHLSLHNSLVDHSKDYFDVVLALLRTGRKGGLEYLNLGRLIVTRSVWQAGQVVREIERNHTILGLVLRAVTDPGWMPGGQFIVDRAHYTLRRNRKDRARTHETAVRLLFQFRCLFHRPAASSLEGGVATLNLRRAGVADLPMEILLEIVPLVRRDPLTLRQVDKIVEYAADRSTLSGSKRATSKKDFLDLVDCWKWDGVVSRA